MRNEIYSGKEFYIISRSIDNAASCKVVEVCEDSFKVKLNNKNKYEKDESVELFTSSSKGEIYFETIVKEVNDDIISVWFPLSYKYLQRREYTRINSDKEIELLYEDKSIKAKLIDFSAGGMKVKVSTQLMLMSEYKVNFNIDEQLLKIVFEPIRIEADSTDFIVSGKYKDINNSDRITLVQYCYRKYIEECIK